MTQLSLCFITFAELETSTAVINSDDYLQVKRTMIDTSMTSESGLGNETEQSTSFATPSYDSSSTNSSLNTVISQTSVSPSEQQALAPYRLQLEGRRRLNTLERIRERHQTVDPNQFTPQQQQLQSDYTLKPEELQDPIIRRALERFDEKNRALIQAKPTNYDDIQDPITRRALMRLETNLKRTMPATSLPPPISHDAHENWYTNSYTLGSLQTNSDPRSVRTLDAASLPPPVPNHKPQAHQRFGSSSSHLLSDPATSSSTGDMHPNGDPRIPVMRLPAQPVYVTSNNQPMSFRQRSRSEDMFSSKDLSVGQTSDFDDTAVNQLQRNHSSEDLQQAVPTSSAADNEEETNQTDDQTDASMEYDVVRAIEATISYPTPRSFLPHADIPSSSAFAPVHSSTNNAYHSQQMLPTSSYTSMYASNQLNQTPYSDDPM